MIYNRLQISEVHRAYILRWQHMSVVHHYLARLKYPPDSWVARFVLSTVKPVVAAGTQKIIDESMSIVLATGMNAIYGCRGLQIDEEPL
jgi:hypothetical protein